ncbi:RHS repeat-associated core domain-containing protein [Colwellia sp. M166]|nr:RHS repeat-associated core domain-containing protein [Colwellia sp. M166]|tara:strand:- start:8223 stop:11231 length:3009 start_codon:yes stop_codon:yes gene_type:complete
MNFSKLTLFITCITLLSNASATEESFTYTSDSLISTINGKRVDVSDITSFTYDVQNNLSKITNALGQETTFSNYTSKGKPRTIIDSNNITTELQYNSRGQVISTTRGSRSITYQYNEYGLLTSSTLPLGDILTFMYDDSRRISQIVNSANESINYTYNTKGNITNTQYLNSVGEVVGSFSSSFDELGRKLTDTAGYLNRTYNYDTMSNLTSYSMGSNSTTNDFDELNRLIKVTDVLLGQTILTYDVNDALISVTDAAQNPTQYSPDFKGDNEQLVSLATGTTQFTNDEVGNVLSRTDARGIITQFAYDALNRLVSVNNAGSEEDVTFNYDNSQSGRYGIGKLTSIVQLNDSINYYYNEFGETTKTTIAIEGHHYSVSYNYNNGLLTKVVYPSGREIIYTYNTIGQIVKVDSFYQGESLTLADSINYLPQGAVKSLTYGNGKLLTNTFDMGYFLTSRQVTDVVDYTYSYDSGGNIDLITNNLEVANSLTLTYDLKHRLTDVTKNLTNSQFTYDETDNRVSKQVDGELDNYSYENTKLTTLNSETLTYDNNGNLAQKGSDLFTYNLANRLSSVITAFGTYNYLYNALGQRIQKKSVDVDIHYVYDHYGQLIYEIDIGTNITTEYVYLNGNRLTFHQGKFSSGKIIIDDNDENVTVDGEWKLVTKRKKKGKKKFKGIGYLKSPKGNGENSVVWPILNVVRGQYQVYARWVKKRKNASNAPFSINHALGQDIIRVDQSKTGSSWQLLGSYTLDAESSIALSNDANGNVIADAIKIKPLDGEAILTSDDYFIHTNHLGAPVALTDESAKKVWQASYAPFGKAIVNDDFDGDGLAVVYNSRLPGQYWDEEKSSYYNYFRDYDPELGRYIQSDPIGLAGGINTYGYVGGNPIMRFDPYGLDWFKPSNHPYSVGRKGATGFEPGKGITGFIDNYIPAGHTFGHRHDSMVGYMEKNWTALPEWSIDYILNPITMPLAYPLAVFEETTISIEKLLQNDNYTHSVQQCEAQQE